MMKRYLCTALLLVAGGGPARAQDPDSVRRQVEQIRAAMFLESAQVGTEARRLVSEGRSATQVLQWQNEQIRQIGDRAVAAMQRLKDGPVKPPAVSPNKPLLVGVWRSATRDDAGITWVRNLSVNGDYAYVLEIAAFAPNGATVPHGTTRGQVSYYEDGVAYLTSYSGASQRSQVSWQDNNQFTLTTPGTNVSLYQRLR
jgi:hypothetical protein